MYGPAQFVFPDSSCSARQPRKQQRGWKRRTIRWSQSLNRSGRWFPCAREERARALISAPPGKCSGTHAAGPWPSDPGTTRVPRAHARYRILPEGRAGVRRPRRGRRVAVTPHPTREPRAPPPRRSAQPGGQCWTVRRSSCASPRTPWPRVRVGDYVWVDPDEPIRTSPDRAVVSIRNSSASSEDALVPREALTVARKAPRHLVVRDSGEVLHHDVPAQQGGVEHHASRLVSPVSLRDLPTPRPSRGCAPRRRVQRGAKNICVDRRRSASVAWLGRYARARTDGTEAHAPVELRLEDPPGVSRQNRPLF